MLKFVKIFLVALLLVSCSKKDENKNAEDYNLIISTSNGDVKYLIEEAITPNELQKGLMFRENLPANSGMIFDLKGAENVAMWMKNTKVPLDMIFLDPDGTINWIYENAVPMSEDYILPPFPPASVIELNAGDVKKNNIKIGDVVKHKMFNNMPNAETPTAENVAPEVVAEEAVIISEETALVEGNVESVTIDGIVEEVAAPMPTSEEIIPEVITPEIPAKE